MINFLKKDNWFLGIAIGLLLPLTVFGIVFVINLFFSQYNLKGEFLKESTVYLISIFMNLVPFRFYMIKGSYIKTGKGILLVTMLYAAVFFIKFL